MLPRTKRYKKKKHRIFAQHLISNQILITNELKARLIKQWKERKYIPLTVWSALPFFFYTYFKKHIANVSFSVSWQKWVSTWVACVKSRILWNERCRILIRNQEPRITDIQRVETKKLRKNAKFLRNGFSERKEFRTGVAKTFGTRLRRFDF